MELLVGIGVLVSVVWATVFALRGRLVDGCLVYLLVVSCFGHAFLSFDVSGAPLTLDRVVLLFVVCMYLVRRRLGRLPATTFSGADRLVVAFLGWLTASLVYGLVIEGSTPGVIGFFQLFGGYAMPAMVYWIARFAPVDDRQLKRVQIALTLFGVYLGLTGMLEIAQAWSLVFPRYIANPKIGLHFGRARGPMIHSVSFGVYLCAALGAAWMWRARLGRAGQLAVLGLATFPLAGVYFCYTRSVWIGLGLALLVVWGLSLRGAWRSLVVGGMLVAALMLAATQMDNLVGFKREFSEAETRDSAQVRGVFAYLSWNMFCDRPLLGVGFGQFRTAKLPYLSDRESEFRLEAIRDWVHHNNYLSLLTETGAVGLALFLALLVAWARRAWHGWHQAELSAVARGQCLLTLAMLSVYAAQLLFHELSFSPLDNSLVWFLAGLTGAVTASAAAPSPGLAAAPGGWFPSRPCEAWAPR